MELKFMAAMAVSTANASQQYDIVYQDLDGNPALVQSSADNGTIDLVGEFDLTNVDAWAPTRPKPGQSLSYSHSCSSGSWPVFDIVYTICESSISCSNPDEYHLYDDSDFPGPNAVGDRVVSARQHRPGLRPGQRGLRRAGAGEPASDAGGAWCRGRRARRRR